MCGPRDGKVLLRCLDLPRAAKKNMSWKWGVGAVRNSWSEADHFFSERGRRGTYHPYRLYKYLHSLFLAYLNNEAEFYVLIYREIPVVIF